MVSYSAARVDIARRILPTHARGIPSGPGHKNRVTPHWKAPCTDSRCPHDPVPRHPRCASRRSRSRWFRRILRATSRRGCSCSGSRAWFSPLVPEASSGRRGLFSQMSQPDTICRAACASPILWKTRCPFSSECLLRWMIFWISRFPSSSRRCAFPAKIKAPAAANHAPSERGFRIGQKSAAHVCTSQTAARNRWSTHPG